MTDVSETVCTYLFPIPNDDTVFQHRFTKLILASPAANYLRHEYNKIITHKFSYPIATTLSVVMEPAGWALYCMCQTDSLISL